MNATLSFPALTRQLVPQRQCRSLTLGINRQHRNKRTTVPQVVHITKCLFPPSILSVLPRLNLSMFLLLRQCFLRRCHRCLIHLARLRPLIHHGRTSRHTHRLLSLTLNKHGVLDGLKVLNLIHGRVHAQDPGAMLPRLYKRVKYPTRHCLLAMSGST